MSTRSRWSLLLLSFVLVATGCPTRVVTYADGGRDTIPASGGAGGRTAPGAGGGAGKGEIGGQAGASTSGEGGHAAAGGVGGSNPYVGGASGSAGSAGTAAASGQAGASGAGGMAGVGPPVGGAGGFGNESSGTVVCGQVAACPLKDGGRCCYSAMDQSSACQGFAATCEPVPATGGMYYVKTTIGCDSSNDCAAGEICCYTQLYISSSTACMTPSSCVDVPPPTGGYNTYRRQVCDPTRIAPTECLSGSCKAAPTYSQNLPAYLHLCL